MREHDRARIEDSRRPSSEKEFASAEPRIERESPYPDRGKTFDLRYNYYLLLRGSDRDGRRGRLRVAAEEEEEEGPFIVAVGVHEAALSLSPSALEEYIERCILYGDAKRALRPHR